MTWQKIHKKTQFIPKKHKNPNSFGFFCKKTVDVTVSHPVAASLFPLSEERARRHLGQEEHAKRTKEGPQCGAAAWGFHAAAYSPWGGQGPSARALLFAVVKRACADSEGWSRAERARDIKHTLSVALAKGVAQQLAARLRVVGRSESDLCWDDAFQHPPS